MALSSNSSSGSALPTIGQFERELSQKLQSFYREHLGQRPSKVSAQLFGTKLAVVLEDTVTQPERLLLSEGKNELAERVREDLDQALQPELQALVEDILSVQVIDILSDSTLDSGRVGIIVVLAEEPKYRQKQGSA